MNHMRSSRDLAHVQIKAERSSACSSPRGIIEAEAVVYAKLEGRNADLC